MMLKKCTLQTINISINPIGDDGILLITEGLQCNKTLTNLQVSTCGLSVTGNMANIEGNMRVCVHVCVCMCNNNYEGIEIISKITTTKTAIPLN